MLLDAFAIRALGLGALLPAAISAVIVILCGFLGRRRAGVAALGGPLALALGVWAGYFSLELGPLYTPRLGWSWLPHLTAFVAPAAWAVARYGQRLLVKWGLLASTFAALATVVPDWSMLQALNLFWVVVLGNAVILLTSIAFRVIPHFPKLGWVAGQGTAIAAGAVVLFLGGNGKLAQAAGVLAAALGGIAFILLAVRRFDGTIIVRGAIPGSIVALIGLMYSGYANSFGSIPNGCYLLVAVAPLLMTVSLIPAVRRGAVGVNVAITLGCVLLPLATAVVWAALT